MSVRKGVRIKELKKKGKTVIGMTEKGTKKGTRMALKAIGEAGKELARKKGGNKVMFGPSPLTYAIIGKRGAGPQNIDYLFSPEQNKEMFVPKRRKL